jgi:hypothetical protein
MSTSHVSFNRASEADGIRLVTRTRGLGMTGWMDLLPGPQWPSDRQYPQWLQRTAGSIRQAPSPADPGATGNSAWLA